MRNESRMDHLSLVIHTNKCCEGIRVGFANQNRMRGCARVNIGGAGGCTCSHNVTTGGVEEDAEMVRHGDAGKLRC